MIAYLNDYIFKNDKILTRVQFVLDPISEIIHNDLQWRQPSDEILKAHPQYTNNIYDMEIECEYDPKLDLSEDYIISRIKKSQLYDNYIPQQSNIENNEVVWFINRDLAMDYISATYSTENEMV